MKKIEKTRGGRENHAEEWGGQAIQDQHQGQQGYEEKGIGGQNHRSGKRHEKNQRGIHLIS